MTLRGLPPNYTRILTLDTAADRRLALRLDLAALAVAAVMLALGLIFVPFESFVYLRVPDRLDIIKLAALIPAICAYTVLHALLRGAFMRRRSKLKPDFGLAGLLPYAASAAYFDRRDFTAVTLAPTLIFALVYLVLGALLPSGWFWFAYILQIVNLSGAVCDFYAAIRAIKLPPDTLVCDSGRKYEFFVKTELVEK